MSIIKQAKDEMNRIGLPDHDQQAMLSILRIFFDTWDSGGAVSVAAPMLQRLIAGKPLFPLTGRVDEWHQPMAGDPILQNVRCSSVFKYPDGVCRDIDLPDHQNLITFPYSPAEARVRSPVMEVSTK